MKLFGNFRWLALISGALIMALVCWAFWPESQGSIPTLAEKIIVTRTDSTGIQALRDSLAIFKASSLKVHIKRRTEKQTTPSGFTEVTYLDSSAAYTDTLKMVEILHDTVYTRVIDSSYVETKNTPIKKKKNVFMGMVYYDESRAFGGSIGYQRALIGPFGFNAYGDYQDSLEIGVGPTVNWKIFKVSAVVRNYGFEANIGYKVSGGVEITF